ncbi:MAG: DMT family transporter [Verrucomicrobiota bacterium]
MVETSVPFYLLLPLGSAMIYALSTLFLKRGLKEGARLRQAVHLTNIAVGIVVCPLYLFQKDPVVWNLIWQPIAMSFVFYGAGWMTVWAMRQGDVSLVTPVMGTKVVFVALGSAFLLGEELPLFLVVAVGLTAVGIFVLGIPDIAKSNATFGPAILLAMLSAMMFATCDLMVKEWAIPFGKHAFIAVASNGVAIISMLDIALSRLPGREPYPRAMPKTRFWIWGSALLTAMQALIIGVVLATTGDATGVNVVYASRGLWAILLVWAVGHHFANRERHEAGKFFVWRVVGASMLTLAVFLAVIARSEHAEPLPVATIPELEP